MDARRVEGRVRTCVHIPMTIFEEGNNANNNKNNGTIMCEKKKKNDMNECLMDGIIY